MIKHDKQCIYIHIGHMINQDKPMINHGFLEVYICQSQLRSEALEEQRRLQARLDGVLEDRAEAGAEGGASTDSTMIT